ncbi:MAG: DUF1152 domain-containing protein, partial [Candidatus Kapaibacterium sp.]
PAFAPNYARIFAHTQSDSMLTLPLFDHMRRANSILLVGAGGGFDIVAGLPLYFALQNAGKQVHLANLSFSDLASSSARWPAPGVAEVTAATSGDERYFPELHLARWLHLQGEPAPVYALEKGGALPLRDAYDYLARSLDIDLIVLVDGGTDSLMRGDEPGLGTPVEDMASIAAADLLDGPETLLICLGFGVDRFHGVRHAYVLEGIAELIRADGFLGAWTLTKEMPEVGRYRDAVEYLNRSMSGYPGIVSASILAAIAGEFGDHHATTRTHGTEQFINSLMSLYWCFRLPAVARRILFIDELRRTTTATDVERVIEIFREGNPPRPDRIIPL